MVDAEDKIVRGGAEGVWALPTPFRASALGAQKLLTEEDVERVAPSLCARTCRARRYFGKQLRAI